MNGQVTGIVGVTDEINARLTATLTGLALAVPTFRFGKDELNVQEAPPRIVWVPKRGATDGKFKPAPDHKTQVAPAYGGDPAAVREAVNPRPLWRRRVGLEAHVWAVRADVTTDRKFDYTAAELLANHLVDAVHDEMYGAYSVTSEDWGTMQESKQRHGVVLVVGLELEMTWTRELDARAVVTAMPVQVGSAH